MNLSQELRTLFKRIARGGKKGRRASRRLGAFHLNALIAAGVRIELRDKNTGRLVECVK